MTMDIEKEEKLTIFGTLLFIIALIYIIVEVVIL